MNNNEGVSSLYDLIPRSVRVMFAIALALALETGTASYPKAIAQQPVGHSEEAEEAHDTEGGTIVGLITYEGDVPKARNADDAGRRRDLLHVDDETRGLRYAVAYLVLPSLQAEGDQSARPEKPRTIDQKDHTFVPHLIAIRSGQTVRFTNSDPANHNVRAASLVEKNNFNIFTGVGGEYRHRFFADRKARPVLLACDIHPWMRWIYVFDHPYYAVTDTQGHFEIAGIKPGKHRLIVRQPDGGFHHEREVEVHAGQRSRIKINVTRDMLKSL